MKIKNGKKIGLLLALFLSVLCLPIGTNAQNDVSVNGFQIIPELEEDQINKIDESIDKIGNTGGNVRKEYNQVASGMTTSEQLASGVMNRDTIVNYLVYVVKFISQLGIVVGVVFIMYAGYKYMISVFEGGKTPTSTVKNAIIGVIIVIFSYAIMRILTSLVGLS